MKNRIEEEFKDLASRRVLNGLVCLTLEGEDTFFYTPRAIRHSSNHKDPRYGVVTDQDIPALLQVYIDQGLVNIATLYREGCKKIDQFNPAGTGYRVNLSQLEQIKILIGDRI